jgi:4a-hydroxytetrahydrobiopterin dehydratase
MARQRLSDEEVKRALTGLRGWTLEKGELVRTWSFADFKQAMKFVNRVADQAESANHHPDIDIRYNKVRLALMTHDAGGITKNDTEMAEKFSQLND